MLVFRKATFETNSSGSHILGFLTQEEVEQLKRGEFWVQVNEDVIYGQPNLVKTPIDVLAKQRENHFLYSRYYTLDEYCRSHAANWEMLDRQLDVNWDEEPVKIEGHIRGE